MKPSDYCRRQVWVTFQEDVPGLQVASYIGEDKIMWGSDYPHPDSTWPHSRKALEEHMYRPDAVAPPPKQATPPIDLVRVV